MTGPQVVTRPGGGVVLRLRTGQQIPFEPQTERERILLALLEVRIASRRSSRAAMAGWEADLSELIRRHLTEDPRPLTRRRAQQLIREVREVLRGVETRLLVRVREAVTGVQRAQRRSFPELPKSFEVRTRVAARAGRNPLRRSAAIVTDSTRAQIEAYIRSVTGREPTDVAVRSIERILHGELPVEISGVTGAAGTKRRGERLIVSETLNTMREGNNQALKTLPGLAAQWRTSGLPNVCPRCLKLSKLDLGFGPGWFPPQLYPRAVHPWCACHQGDIRQLTPEEETLLARLLEQGVTAYAALGWDEEGKEPPEEAE